MTRTYHRQRPAKPVDGDYWYADGKLYRCGEHGISVYRQPISALPTEFPKVILDELAPKQAA